MFGIESYTLITGKHIICITKTFLNDRDVSWGVTGWVGRSGDPVVFYSLDRT